MIEYIDNAILILIGFCIVAYFAKWLMISLLSLWMGGNPSVSWRDPPIMLFGIICGSCLVWLGVSVA